MSLAGNNEARLLYEAGGAADKSILTTKIV